MNKFHIVVSEVPSFTCNFQGFNISKMLKKILKGSNISKLFSVTKFAFIKEGIICILKNYKDKTNKKTIVLKRSSLSSENLPCHRLLLLPHFLLISQFLLLPYHTVNNVLLREGIFPKKIKFSHYSAEILF